MCLALPEAVLFDMDGLLIDSERLSMQSFLESCEAFGLEDQSALFVQLIGSNEASLMAMLEQGIGQRVSVTDLRADWSRRYQAMIADGKVLLKPGVEVLLDWLAEQDIRMAVATSSAAPIAALKLTRTGIIKRFELIIGGDMVKHSKPHPEIYRMAASAVGVDVSGSLVLEDSANGVRAGVAAGCSVIQVPDLVPPEPELLALGHQVCDSLHEVLHCLQLRSSDAVQIAPDPEGRP